MTTRIVCIFPFAYLEWVGSFLIRRPVHEILEGWHVERGYMWPYVLLAYFLSPVVVGLLLSPND